MSSIQLGGLNLDKIIIMYSPSRLTCTTHQRWQKLSKDAEVTLPDLADCRGLWSAEGRLPETFCLARVALGTFKGE